MAIKPTVDDLIGYLNISTPVQPTTQAQLDEAFNAALDDVESRIDNALVIAQGAGDLTNANLYPQRVRTAVLMSAARLNKRPTSAEGVTGFGELGVMRVTPSDPDVERLISHFLKTTGFA